MVPGEVTEVQLRAKYAPNPAAGHWSRWSEPVRAMVPQSSGAKNKQEERTSVTQQLARGPFTDVMV